MKKTAIKICLILGACFFCTGFVVPNVGFLLMFLSVLLFLAAFILFLFSPFRGLKAQKAAKIAKIITFSVLAAGLIFFIIVETLIITGKPDNKNVDAEVIIVLGAGLRGESPSLALKSRLDLAVDFLGQNPMAVAIVSGGQGPGETISEALAMEKYLVQQGIDKNRITLEDRSTSTVENLKYSFAIAENMGLLSKKIAVVSNSFHIYRAKLIAKELGVDVEGLGSPLPEMPLFIINSYVREFVSVCFIYFKMAFNLL